MNFSNVFLTLLQQTSAEKPSLFPFPFSMHLTLVCLGVAFFAYRFAVQKRPNQLLMAIAMLVSMAIWLSESRVLYYAVGAIELVLLIACFVTSLIFNPAEDASEAEEAPADKDEAEDEAFSEESAADAAEEE